MIRIIGDLAEMRWQSEVTGRVNSAILACSHNKIKSNFNQIIILATYPSFPVCISQPNLLFLTRSYSL